MAKEIVTFEVQPYGEFKASIRDFETELRISYRADQQMIARKMDTAQVSSSTRMMFYYLAVYAETCEEQPTGFDAGKLLKSSPSDAFTFLTSYFERLVEKEQSFRGGDEEVHPGEPGQAESAEETV